MIQKKKNHRVYGTPHYVYDFKMLLNTTSTIYLLAGQYNSELKTNLGLNLTCIVNTIHY